MAVAFSKQFDLYLSMHSLHHFPLVQNRTIHSVLVLYNCTDSILWQLSYNLYCVQLVNSMEWGHSSSLHKDKSTKTHPHTHLSSVYDALCCRATQFVLNWNEWLFCCPSVYEGALFILYSKQRLHALDGLLCEQHLCLVDGGLSKMMFK